MCWLELLIMFNTLFVTKTKFFDKELRNYILLVCQKHFLYRGLGYIYQGQILPKIEPISVCSICDIFIKKKRNSQLLFIVYGKKKI